MKTLFECVTKSTRTQSLGLLAIGLAMFACSNLAEQAVTNWITREVAYFVVIAAGITASAILFRRAGADVHRDREE